MADTNERMKAGLETILPLALGVAGAPRGARQGTEDREARELRKEARTDRAENRAYLRRQRNFESEEMEYKRQLLTYTREMDQAISKFIMTDGENVQPALGVFNSRYPGADIKLEKTKGKKGETRYNLTGTLQGSPVDVKGLTKEQVLERLHLSKDPDGWMASQRASKAARATQAGKMEIVAEKGRQDRLTEKEKDRLERGSVGAGGTGFQPGSVEWKRVQDLNRALKGDARKIIQKNYAGTFEGGIWFPDEANKEVALNAMDIAAEKVQGGMPPDRSAREAVSEADAGGWPRSRHITKTIGTRRIKQVGVDTDTQTGFLTPRLVDVGATKGQETVQAGLPVGTSFGPGSGGLPERAQKATDGEEDQERKAIAGVPTVRPAAAALPATQRQPKMARDRQAAKIAGVLVERHTRKGLPKKPLTDRAGKMGGRIKMGQSAWKTRMIGIRDDILEGIEFLSPVEQEQAAELANEINRQMQQ